MARTINWQHHLVWIAFLLLYALSLPFPALEFDGGGPGGSTMPGVAVLLLGWFGLLLGQTAWLANIPWFISIFGVIFRVPLLAAVPASLALLLSLHTLGLYGVPVPKDESGSNNMLLTGIGPGAYLWWAALAAPLLWAIWWKVTGQMRPVSPPRPPRPTPGAPVNPPPPAAHV